MQRFVAFFLFATAIALPSARATEFVVTKTTDTLDGACDEDCSLRETVVASNSGPGHVITIPVGVYRLTRAPAPTESIASCWWPRSVTRRSPG